MLSASPRLAYRRAKSGEERGIARRFSARLSFLFVSSSLPTSPGGCRKRGRKRASAPASAEHRVYRARDRGGIGRRRHWGVVRTTPQILVGETPNPIDVPSGCR